MSDTPAQLTIRLLGAPEVQVAGGSLALNDQKARALLFYLAATGQPYTRDHLATLLWSESPGSNARHSLRSSLYHIRQALHASDADELLVVDGDLVRLHAGDNICDVVRFRRLVAGGSESELEEGVSLYRGPLLQGFTLADAPLFEEWVRSEETRLNQTYLDALHRLGTWAETRQVWNEAIEYIQRIIRIDPLNEEVQRRLIGLYVRSGAIGLALRQYRQFENELRQELGLTPSPETQALFSAVLQSQRSPASLAKPSSRRSRPVSQAQPLVGRDDLLNSLLDLGQDVTAGRGVTVLLQGEDGSGKSRLLDELANALSISSPPWTILQGSCSPFDDLLSYGPFIEAFQNATPGDLTDLLIESHETTPDEQGQFLWRVLQSLSTLTRGAPLLLTIDDLHWANSSTLHLFGFLAARLRTMPVLLVGTVQRAEAIPALQRLLLLGRRHGDVHLFSLPPLSPGAVTTLLQASGVSPTSVTTLAEWLHERSGGSPFILTEILAQLRTEAILLPVTGGWQLDTGRWLRWRASHTLPETIHDLLSWRLANLPADARYLLEVLAVADQPLPLTLLGDLLGTQADQLLSTLDDLVARRLVIEEKGEMFALPHHLLRETLVHRLSHLRRRMIHRQLVEVLESCPLLQKNFPLRQIALHAVAGEDIDRARHYGLQVLPELLQDYAGAQAVDFLHHLYDLLAPTASLDEMLRLTSTLGQSHQSLGHLEAATSWHQQNLKLAQEANDRSAEASAYFEMGELALVTTDYLAAAACAESGLAACGSSEEPVDIGLVARGHRLLGAALAMEGSDLPAAESHLQEAVAADRLSNNLGDLCATLFELGNVAAQRGELQRALEFYEEAARTASTAHAHYFLALAHNNFAYHSLLLGRPEAAQGAVTRGHKLAETYELLGALLHLSSTQGEIHLYLAEWAAASESFQRGLALAEELGNLERQAGYRANLALVARGQHDLESATALLEEALALLTDRGYWHLRTRILLWLAETLLLRGRVAEAGSHLNVALGIARAHGRVLLLLQGERLRARLLAAGNDWHAANALFAQTLERATGLGLSLEIALIQAAWGETALLYSPSPDTGHMLLAEACQAFKTHGARAELQALTVRHGR
jgi:DNA-binding SARP family transcriptional activator